MHLLARLPKDIKLMAHKLLFPNAMVRRDSFPVWPSRLTCPINAPTSGLEHPRPLYSSMTISMPLKPYRGCSVYVLSLTAPLSKAHRPILLEVRLRCPALLASSSSFMTTSSSNLYYLDLCSFNYCIFPQLRSAHL